jgi:hypothetical protein
MTCTKHNTHLKRLREDKKLAADTEMASGPDSENVPAVSSQTAQDPLQIILEQSIVSLKRQCNAQNVNLGPLHKKVKDYCKHVAKDPMVILAGLSSSEDSNLPKTFEK